MSIEEILQLLNKFFRKILPPVLLILLLLLIRTYVIPWLIGIFGASAVYTGLFVFVLVLIAIWILILIFDKGALGTGPCALRKYTFKPDRCFNVSCSVPCIGIKGPYPKWLGSFALLTQDVGCICPTALGSGVAILAPWLQKLFDQAVGIKDQSELERLIEKILREEGINSERLDEILKILDKLKKGEPLTQEDMDKIKQLINNP